MWNNLIMLEPGVAKIGFFGLLAEVLTMDPGAARIQQYELYQRATDQYSG